MKFVSFFSVTLLISANCLLGQGTFIFDQQSSDENRILEGGGTFGGNPIQSFTPTLDSVGFIRLYLMAADINNGSINLRANSPTGPLLGTTLPITVSSFTGPVTFVFGTPIGVTPGTTYYFQPVATVSSGLLNGSQFYDYPGGMAFSSDGTPSPNFDYWFREGVVVPEPSTAALILVASSLVLLLRTGRDQSLAMQRRRRADRTIERSYFGGVA